MTFVQKITKRLRDTSRMAAEAERCVLNDPEDFAAQLNLASVEKHREQLKTEFDSATQSAGLDVCSYRLFGSSSHAMTVFQALGFFQTLFTLTYRSIAHGSKKTATVGREDKDATYFGFSHTFAGSIGVVLTLPNERLLLNESDLDAAMDAVFELSKLTSSAGIREYASKLGLPVIRELHRWGRTHVNNECGADIDWRRGDSVRSSVLIQHQELRALVKAIEATSDEESDTVEVVGTLVGADIHPKRFHFITDEGSEEFRGAYSDAIPNEKEITLNRKYRAEIVRSAIRHYSTDVEDETYFLQSLTPLF